MYEIAAGVPYSSPFVVASVPCSSSSTRKQGNSYGGALLKPLKAWGGVLVGSEEGRGHQEWDFRLGLGETMENYTQKYNQRGDMKKFYYLQGLKLHCIK